LSIRPRVLVADDYPDIVKAVCRSLAVECDVVGTVSDGGALLDAVQRLQPDVIVLDLNLPNVHALTACRQITRINPAMKVIIFSAMSEQAVTDASLAAGATAFVSKLGSGEDLLSVITRLCIDRD